MFKWKIPPGFLCSGGGLPLLQGPEFLWKLSWPFLACAGHLRKSFQRFISCAYSGAEVRNDKLKRQTFRRGMVMVGQGDKIKQPTIGSMSSTNVVGQQIWTYVKRVPCRWIPILWSLRVIELAVVHEWIWLVETSLRSFPRDPPLQNWSSWDTCGRIDYSVDLEVRNPRRRTGTSRLRLKSCTTQPQSRHGPCTVCCRRKRTALVITDKYVIYVSLDLIVSIILRWNFASVHDVKSWFMVWYD